MNNINPMQLIMQMMSGGAGGLSPMNLMGMFNNDPRMKMAQQMLNSGQNPQQVAQNIMKDMNPQQVAQIKQMAQQMGIKL